MSHRGKNKGSGSGPDRYNATWFTNGNKRKRKRNKIATKSRRKNR